METEWQARPRTEIRAEKMRIELESGKQRLTVSFDLNGTQIIAEVDGRKYEGILLNPEPNVYTLIIEGTVHELRAFAGSTEGEIEVHAQHYTSIFKSVDQRRTRHRTGTGTAGIQSITAPMPGRIVRILKEVGTEVAEGEGVVVVEAMKMQNEMTSPKAGKVAKLKVEVGQTVASGDVLAIIE